MQQFTDTFLTTDLEMIARLFIATILGLLIGLEREFKRKAIGLKTILVISIVSCLLTIVSIQSAYLFPATATAEIRMDPLRLAAQIVSGVGFLGAGVILRRGDDTVSGLTTAAIVWGAAGLGIATGAGFYIEAMIGVGLLLISLKLLPFIMDKVHLKKLHLTEQYIRIVIDDGEKMDEVINKVKEHVEEINIIRIKDLKNGEHLLVILVMIKEEHSITKTYNKIARFKHISRMEMRA